MPADPTKLLGKYKTARFRYGDVVTDAVRGDVVIVALSDARIPWPIGKRGRAKSPVVFDAIERAIRTESNLAVCHWWGVSPWLVSKWRKLLGVVNTPGTVRLRRERLQAHGDAMRARIDHSDPDRNRAISDTMRGRKRPRHVVAAMRRGYVGKPLSAEHRRKVSEANKRNGNRPPNGELWTAEADELVRTLSAPVAARRLGRTLTAIYNRRHRLGVKDGRRQG